MKINIHKVLFVTTLMLSSEAFSFSGIVTDIKSYTYYTEQIRKQTELIEKQESMLKKADETIKLQDTTRKSLTSAYRKAKRQTNSIQYDIQRAQDDPLGFAIKLEETIGAMSPQETKQEISKGIDKQYEFKSTSPWQRNRNREEVAQSSVKKLMVLGDEAQLLNAYNLDELESLIADANNAESQKEATDVTNAILTEILKNQLRSIELMAAYHSTFARLHYTNTPQEQAEVSEYTTDDFQQEMTDGLKVNFDLGKSSKSLFDGLKSSHEKEFNE